MKTSKTEGLVGIAMHVLFGFSFGLKAPLPRPLLLIERLVDRRSESFANRPGIHNDPSNSIQTLLRCSIVWCRDYSVDLLLQHIKPSVVPMVRFRTGRELVDLAPRWF